MIIRETSQSYNHSRTKELIIYVAGALCKSTHYSHELLSNALYFIDNLNCLDASTPISQLTYIRDPTGAGVEPKMFRELLKELQRNDDVVLVAPKNRSKGRRLIFPNREAVVSVFNSNELEWMDHVPKEAEEWIEARIIDKLFGKFEQKNGDVDQGLPLYFANFKVIEPAPEYVAWAKSMIPDWEEESRLEEEARFKCTQS
jgi:hypothetical protein